MKVKFDKKFQTYMKMQLGPNLHPLDPRIARRLERFYGTRVGENGMENGGYHTGFPGGGKFSNFVLFQNNPHYIEL